MDEYEDSSMMSEFLIKLKEEVVLTLINTVRRMPELWKQDAPGYRDLCVQQQAWNTIAAQFGVPVENLKEKWKMLRTQFRSNHSKVRNKRLNGSVPKPESIRPVSYVTNCKVEPFIIRTFRNLSKITDQIAQTKASPYSGLLDHLGSVLGRKQQRDFKEIETVLLNCLRELQKFPDVAKERLQGEAETDDEEQLF
uniref:MADF domain-containing protein n=1 Tax=Anopheles melas TaxID=34690 RepID=A0A182UB50_9DIPT